MNMYSSGFRESQNNLLSIGVTVKMTFSVQDYTICGIIVPALVPAALFALAFWGSRCLSKRKFPVYIVIAPILLNTVLFLSGLALLAKGFQFPVSALIQANAPVQIAEGQVTAVRQAPVPPVYYDSATRSFQPAMLITVDGTDYYVLHSEISVGQRLSLAYITEERIVLAWSEDSIEPPPAEVPPASDRAGKENAARILYYVSGALFLILLGGQYLFGGKTAGYLQKKDRQYSEGVVPNGFGNWNFALMLCPFYGILIALGITGFWGGLLVGAAALLIFLWLMVQKGTTCLTLQNGRLIYRQFRTTRIFDADDVEDVSWGASRIPRNRCLAILFRSGFMLVFEQEHFWGLENMYSQLQRRLEPRRKGDN